MIGCPKILFLGSPVWLCLVYLIWFCLRPCWLVWDKFLLINWILRVMCGSIFLSKHLLVRFLYVRLCIEGFVVMLEIFVFGFRPKWASNGVIFVVEFGINLILSMIFAARFAHFFGDQLGSTLFVLVFLPLLFPYGHQLVLGLILCFYFCRILQILPLWKLVLGRIWLSVVSFVVCNNFLGILSLCLCYSYWMFPHVGIVIVYQPLLECNWFVCCFWRGLVLQSSFGFPHLVLLVHLICLDCFLRLLVSNFYLCRCSVCSSVPVPRFHYGYVGTK